jgi:hypothetical protein
MEVAPAELWRPLSYPDPERLVVAYSRGPGERSWVDAISEEELDIWREGTPALVQLVGIGSSTRRTLRLDVAESISVTPVTSNYFDTLARPIVAGRAFTAADAGGSPLAVLTESAWQRVFRSDRSVVGGTVMLDAQPVVIAGVVATNDSLGPDDDLFVNLDAGTEAARDRAAPIFYGTIARLAPDVEVAVAKQQLQRVMEQLAAADPERWTGRTLHVESLRSFYTSVPRRRWAAASSCFPMRARRGPASPGGCSSSAWPAT